MQTRSQFLRTMGLGAAALAVPGCAGQFAVGKGARERPNILFVTVDDMNWDTPASFGGRVPGVTPNIDRLAAEGMRFYHGHVTIGVCQPSRECLMTGRYPHRNGGIGFNPINRDVPTLQEQLHQAGYINGILGKVTHLAPKDKFMWSMDVDQYELGAGRDPDIYYRNARAFLEQASRENHPFFLMANSHDPHRPYHDSLQEESFFNGQWKKRNVRREDVPPPSRVYRPEEVEVPGFLPDIPDVRKEVAQYYSSSRRADDTVGAVLRALRDSGQEDNTLVMFLSDNGIALPFAKTNCYLHSTRTPWIVRWPGRVRPGTVDERHFISGIDFMPTVLETAGLSLPEGMDGGSFLPLLNGEPQEGRHQVFTVFHETSGKREYPMRCVQDRRFGYIFNAWADGETRFRNESQNGLTMNAMIEAAKTDRAIADRVLLFLYRVPEELYDFASDPDARHNLADSPEHKEQLAQKRRELLAWMERTGDLLLPTFQDHLNA